MLANSCVSAVRVFTQWSILCGLIVHFFSDMKNVIIALIAIVVIGGGLYWWSQQPATEQPSTNKGVNGSQNQGNLGGTDQGVVQRPLEDGAEGSIIGNNLALGTSVDTKLGTYLIGYNGMTVYTYDRDTTAKSTCDGICADNWPPYIVGPEDNVAQVKAGVTGKTGTIIRTDGRIQVTYNGKPLYFFGTDKTSGDTKGDGVVGEWHVAKP